jgi:hypothetical protein
MSAYSTRLLLTLSNLTSVEEETRDLVGQVLQEARESLEEIATKFRLQEVTPATTYQFETELAEAVREMARRLTGQVYNSLEPKEAEQMPHHVHYEGGGYRRRNDQTRNGHVATLFGTIELWRYAYRDWHGSDGCIFPLELQLGLVQGATPALAEVAARYLGEAGASQAAVLERLKQQHNVSWGAERLRSVAQEVAEAMAAVREDVQVEPEVQFTDVDVPFSVREEGFDVNGESHQVLTVAVNRYELSQRLKSVATWPSSIKLLVFSQGAGANTRQLLGEREVQLLKQNVADVHPKRVHLSASSDGTVSLILVSRGKEQVNPEEVEVSIPQSFKGASYRCEPLSSNWIKIHLVFPERDLRKRNDDSPHVVSVSVPSLLVAFRIGEVS